MKKTILSIYSLLCTTMMLTPVVFAGNPNTGDNSIVNIMLIVGGIALVLMVLFFITGKKGKGKKK